MAKAALFLLSLLAVSFACDAYKILLIFPLPSKSHLFLANGMVRHLLKAGHEVTLLTPYVDKNPPPNLHQIDASSIEELTKEYADQIRIEDIMKAGISTINPLLLPFMTRVVSVKVMEDVNVQNFLKDKSQHFDLVIAEWLYNEIFASFATIYDAPLIWFSSSEPDTMLISVVDGYFNPSYNSLIVTDDLPYTFMQRLSQLWYSSLLVIFRETIMSYLQTRDYNRLVVPHIEARGRVAPEFSELKYNASLVLGMSHVSMGSAATLPQMYKHIGGYHIDDEVKPLPEDLKKIMDNAKDGVIYFSMGSSLKSKEWPETLKREFVEMFGTLKQTVIWKFEETLPDMPKNLHILQWAPQQSILAHPNCLLFITHGGMLSTTETLHTGKPIIGMPAFGDQFTNVVSAASKGFAIKVDLSYTMVKELKEAIKEILTNPKYTQKAKELSFVYHDRPVKPGDELVHWAEHVIKTHGAPHLRSPALLVPWYQKYYLDLAALITLIIIVLRKTLQVLLPLILPKRFDNKQKIKTN